MLVGKPILRLQIVDRNNARIEVERELCTASGPDQPLIMYPPVRRFVAAWKQEDERAKSITRRKELALPLNALDLDKLSMYIENSFRFSGNTSWPGGCDPENIFRYPLKISTVFSEILARISLRFLSSVLEAARIRNEYELHNAIDD